jgi:RNA polymerase sigma-70 factor, ECF subfamily
MCEARPPVEPLPARAGDDETRRWVRELGTAGAIQDLAVKRLHELLLRVAYAEIRRRGARPTVTGPELDDLAHQAADDAVLAVVTKLTQFRGESRFTTWAYRFVVLEVSTKLGRHFWKRSTIALDSEDWEHLPDRFGIAPEDHVLRREFIDAVRTVVHDRLSDHQRQVFMAIAVDRIPVDALTITLGSNRNAIYKTLYDARRKLRAALVEEGYLDPAPQGGIERLSTGATE